MARRHQIGRVSIAVVVLIYPNSKVGLRKKDVVLIGSVITHIEEFIAAAVVPFSNGYFLDCNEAL